MPDKRRERFYLEMLRQALPDVPSVTPLEPEPPDFVFVDNGHRLGIELTLFHLPPKPGEPPHQERQSLKDQIVARAERLHAEAGGPALYVGVIFHESERLRKRDVQRFARQLAHAILAYPVPQRFEEQPIQIPWGCRPSWTAGIQAHGSIDGSDRLWHADAGGWVASIASDQISEVVKRKAQSESRARAECDELWLVIVNDTFSRAAQAEISLEALDASYEGPFDRLLWFLPHAPRAIDLQLNQRSE